MIGFNIGLLNYQTDIFGEYGFINRNEKIGDIKYSIEYITDINNIPKGLSCIIVNNRDNVNKDYF